MFCWYCQTLNTGSQYVRPIYVTMVGVMLSVYFLGNEKTFLCWKVGNSRSVVRLVGSLSCWTNISRIREYVKIFELIIKTKT
jgi:hypothetical protein